MSNILITGATGFIGRHLVSELLNDLNFNIMVIVRDESRAIQMFKNRCSCATIDNEDAIINFNPDFVIHLASMLTSRNDSDIIEDIIASNITFGVKLLNILGKCNGIKLFVNTGSFAEYRLGIENVNNAYLYSATKTAYASFLDYYSNLNSMQYINIIPYTVYGGLSDQKKIIDYVKDSLYAEAPVKMTQGNQILDFIHVDDVVSFYKFVIVNYQKITNKETYFLGTGKGTSIRELATMMEKAFNRTANIDWGALPYRSMDVMYAVAPIQKLISLCWHPTVELEDYILYEK